MLFGYVQIKLAGRQDNRQAEVTITQCKFHTTIMSFDHLHMFSRQAIHRSSCCIFGAKTLVKGDSSLDGRLVPHSLETLRPLIKLEGFVDNAMNLDFASVEVMNGSRDYG